VNGIIRGWARTYVLFLKYCLASPFPLGINAHWLTTRAPYNKRSCDQFARDVFSPSLCCLMNEMFHRPPKVVEILGEAFHLLLVLVSPSERKVVMSGLGL